MKESEHMDRLTETKIVKAALIKAGYANVRVRHATGTAWGWIDVLCDQKPAETWTQHHDNVQRLVQLATGRHGEYGGCITVA